MLHRRTSSNWQACFDPHSVVQTMMIPEPRQAMIEATLVQWPMRSRVRPEIPEELGRRRSTTIGSHAGMRTIHHVTMRVRMRTMSGKSDVPMRWLDEMHPR